MALHIFNFDGTGNEPEDAIQNEKKGRVEDDNISNILKLHFMFGGNLFSENHEYYGQSAHENVAHSFYYQGVGTYGNWWQRLLNQGLSPESKNVSTILNKAFDDFNQSYQPGDQLLVTGFSRGAALARRFCAKLIEKSSLVSNDSTPFIYLGVFDTVASIGLPNLSKSERPDYDVVFEDGCTLCSVIKQATHLVSLDDKRKAFQPTLMNCDQERIVEIWFAGAHSDVGGGYYRDGLSDVALDYFLNWLNHQINTQQLISPQTKLPTSASLTARLPERLRDAIGIDDIEKNAKPLGKNHQQDRWPVVDWLTLEDRLCCVIDNDKVCKHQKPIIHHAVTTRIAFDDSYRPKSLRNQAHSVWHGFEQDTVDGLGFKSYIGNPNPVWHSLEVDESLTRTVFAATQFNHTNILVAPGETYLIEANADSTWNDGGICCNADGWSTDTHDMGWKKLPIKIANKLRRVTDSNWLALCATVGENDEWAQSIGLKSSYKTQCHGELTLFANDIAAMMSNNIGAISIKITRLT